MAQNNDTVALVPIGATAPQLAQQLGAEALASLRAAMLIDVITALSHSPVDRIMVVAQNAAVAAPARALGIDVILDPPGSADVNDALAYATGQTRSPLSVLTVAADLPRLHPDDIDALFAEDAQVVVAPTHTGGTGALLRTPPTVINPALGPKSSIRHFRLANEAGVRVASVDTHGTRWDVDTWDDVLTLNAPDVGAATRAIITKWGIEPHRPGDVVLTEEPAAH